MDSFAKLDELRKSVNHDDIGKTWKEAETALTQALCAKRQKAKAIVKEARLDDISNIADGLATHGEACRLRKWKTLTRQPNPQASPPLQCASATGQKVLALANTDRLLTDEDLGFGFITDVTREPESDTCSASEEISARVIAKQQALHKKTQLLRERKESAFEHTSEHGRRKLRAKIAAVLLEVRRRQELNAQQQRAKKFREKKFSRGMGPHASLGDLPRDALGLASQDDSSDTYTDSPRRSALRRRTALLDSLSLEDFALLRRNPEWFFSGPAIASSAPSETHSLSCGGASSSSSLPAQLDSHSPTSSTETFSLLPNRSRSTTSAATDCVFHDLAIFFSPTSDDMKLDVAQWVQKLRAKSTAMDNETPKIVYTNGEGEFRKSLMENANKALVEEPVTDEAPPPPLEMMPCCGRHPQIRDDKKSPTLVKMREVITKKQEQDARFVEDRRKAIEGKSAANASKANEQQQKNLLEVMEQKEAHKAKKLEAEERKSMLEVEKQERIDLQNIKKISQVMLAGEKAEDLKDIRRHRVQASLDRWQEGVARASQQQRRADIEKKREGQRSQKKYMERLNAIGASRQVVITTQAQKSDEIKADIHNALTLDRAEQDYQERIALKEACKKKQEDAALRRQKAKWGYRYCFSERAFGVNAGDYDAKHHMVAVDRRGDSWRRSAKEWASTKGTFSMPEIPTTRTLSPGGSMGADLVGPISEPISPISVTLDKSETTFFLT